MLLADVNNDSKVATPELLTQTCVRAEWGIHVSVPPSLKVFWPSVCVFLLILWINTQMGCDIGIRWHGDSLPTLFSCQSKTYGIEILIYSVLSRNNLH